MHFQSLSCVQLCDPKDCSPPGSFVYETLQARILEWVAMTYSRGSSQPRDKICISCVSSIKVRFFTTEPPSKPTLISINKFKNIYHIHLIYKCLYLSYSTNKPRLPQRILHLGSCHENLYV